MKRIIIGLAALAFAGSVAADNSVGRDNNTNNRGEIYSESNSYSESYTVVNGNVGAPAAQAQGQSVTVTTPKQAVGASAPSINPTAMCMVPVTGGLGGTFGGISLGTTVRDYICSKLEVGKALIQVGMALGDMESVTLGRALIHEAAADLVAAAGKSEAPAVEAESYAQ